MSLLLAGLSLVALVFSTSTTAYLGLAAYLAASYVACATRAISDEVGTRTLLFLVFAPLLILSAGLVLAANETTAALIQEILDKLVFNKLSSQSGMERSAWNEQALTNFWQTWGFGAGVGSVRASSFLLAVPANVGVIGSVTYGAFLFSVVSSRARPGEDLTTCGIRAAAGSACLALVIAASLAGSFIDLGLPFFVFAALAAAKTPESVRLTSRSWARCVSLTPAQR
jgi:hypothetical protein